MSNYDQLHAEYRAWKRENPEAIRALCDVIRQRIEQGAKKWSVGAAFEVVLWEHARLKKKGEFKMPHNHRAFFARDWMAAFGDKYPDFFQTCRQRSVGGVIVDRFGVDAHP